MNLETIIYLADILPTIKISCSVILIIGICIFGPLCLILLIVGDDEGINLSRTIFRIAWKVILGLALLAVFIPRESTIYRMAGISMIKTASQSPEAQKTLKLINAGLDKALNKLEDSK